jgi:butyrate kinase
VKILVINPGGGSTKIGIWDNQNKIFEQTIKHSPKELAKFPDILDQKHLRYNVIVNLLTKNNFNLSKFEAIATRGGPLKPLSAGTYRINKRVINDIKKGNVQTQHPSLLGPIIAYELGNRFNIPAFFVDPESVDEFEEIARISGLSEIQRSALSHATSVKMVVRKAAAHIHKPVNKCNFLVAHLGTGITIAAHKNGRMVDSTNANEDGPFGPQRSGSLPFPSLVEMCFSGKFSKDQIIDKIQRKGGLFAYLGTDNLKEIEKQIKKGDKKASLIYQAMIYQIAKEMGAYAVVLKGKIDAIILTGGMTLSHQLINKLKKYIKFLCPKIFVFPGEVEMEALASGVQNVLNGKEKEKIYA